MDTSSSALCIQATNDFDAWCFSQAEFQMGSFMASTVWRSEDKDSVFYFEY